MALAAGRPRTAGERLEGLPHLRGATSQRRHRSHRGAVPGGPPRRRAVWLRVSVRAAVRDARPANARPRREELAMAVTEIAEALPATARVRPALLAATAANWRDYV